MNDDVPPSTPRRSRRGGHRQGSARVPGVLLVVVGLVVAASALRPDGGLLGTGTEPPLGSIGFVVLLALGWVIVVGRFASGLREEVRRLTGPTPWAERLRTAAVVLLAGGTVAVPVLLFVFHNRTTTGGPVADAPLTGLGPWTATPVPTPPPPPAPEASGTVNLAVVLLVVLAAVVAAVLVAALVRGWRRLRLPGPGSRTAPAVGPARAEDVLAEAVATGRRALRGGDARAAVIACYAAMEGSLAASGVARHASDSPTELLERAVADDRVDPVQARALTALFHEARYSTHPMDDSQVRRARTALDTIADRLADRPAAGTAGAGPTDPTGSRR
ncbi:MULTISPECIES: DUF4129 domain-containing protein [unclassified Kitasatospora]|uniref:DUF4129 domain-containing protein n=1 Tax=unclassified Kitasatospora TaxID=2633591 RepID=UPI00382DB2B9